MNTSLKEIQDLSKDLSKSYEEKKINIFLCGQNTSNQNSIRAKLNKEFSNHDDCFIVYPEWLFPDLLKKINLLELEKSLVGMVNSVVIPLSTVSTYAELGAFVINPDLINRVIIINDIKYKGVSSFIKLGPLDLIKSKANKNQLIWFNEIDSEIEEITKKIIRETKRIKKDFPPKQYNIFELSTLIQFLVALHQPIKTRELKAKIREIKGFDLERDFQPAINILIEKKIISVKNKMIKTRKIKEYSLSDFGHKEIIENRLEKYHLKTKYYDLRSQIINSIHGKKYNINHFGRKHFLDDFDIKI